MPCVEMWGRCDRLISKFWISWNSTRLAICERCFELIMRLWSTERPSFASAHTGMLAEIKVQFKLRDG